MGIGEVYSGTGSSECKVLGHLKKNRSWRKPGM